MARDDTERSCVQAGVAVCVRSFTKLALMFVVEHDVGEVCLLLIAHYFKYIYIYIYIYK